jgi:hypothetical protein
MALRWISSLFFLLLVSCAPIVRVVIQNQVEAVFHKKPLWGKEQAPPSGAFVGVKILRTEFYLKNNFHGDLPIPAYQEKLHHMGEKILMDFVENDFKKNKLKVKNFGNIAAVADLYALDLSGILKTGWNEDLRQAIDSDYLILFAPVVALESPEKGDITIRWSTWNLKENVRLERGEFYNRNLPFDKALLLLNESR